MTVAMTLLLTTVALPLRAQSDLSGSWLLQEDEDVMERIAGPVADDFTGIPLNDSGRALGLSYSPSSLSEPERICRQEPLFSNAIGPWNLNIWPQVNPATRQVVAWHLSGTESHSEMTIWMDGRPQPSKDALHLRGGFTTGTWKGDMLIAQSTHLEAGILRRSGAFSSDKTTMTTTFIPHGDLLAAAYIINDPIYLTEPYPYTVTYVRTDRPVGRDWDLCIVGYEGVDEGQVPFYLPGKNPLVGQMKKIYNIPEEASLGGAQTMYPAFRDKLKAQYLKLYSTFPKKCTLYCTTSFGPPPPRKGSGKGSGN